MSSDPQDRDVPAPAPAPPPSRLKDLGLRLVSAAVLAAVSAGLLYAGALPFATLILVITLLMCWEWGHIVRNLSQVDSVLVVHGLAVAAAVLLAAPGYAALALITLIAGTLVVAVLRFGQGDRFSALGVPYVGVPAVALVSLRNGHEPYGFYAVLFVILAVIATDTLAYFTGRAVGGPKLWPAVSPNKTWSGLLGGIGGAALVGYAFGHWLPGSEPVRMAAIGLLIGIVAQAGDLAESGLKRSFDVKDASTLIPGHGGFMDRMDGLVAAAVAADVIGLIQSVYEPARALLLGF